MLVRFSIIALSMITVSQQAHAKSRLDIAASSEQVSRMESGREVVDSDQEFTSVRIFETDELVKKRGIMTVLAFNAGDKPFNLGSENIAMETETGEPIAVIPYEQLEKELKNKQMWAAIATQILVYLATTGTIPMPSDCYLIAI
jgi:hypothetical protein